MAVTFTLRQVTSVVDGPLYRVVNTASVAAFVYKTLTNAFSHYATAVDVELYPESAAEAVATSKAFYRLPTLIRDWATATEMITDVGLTLDRVQLLSNDLTALNTSVTMDRTTVITGV